MLNRDRVFFVDQVAAPHRLQALSAVGVSLPASCAAIEKALLTGLTDEQVERLLPERLPAETPNTITDRAGLLADLERVRAGGVAYDREELTIGISAVGGRSATPASSSRRSASPCRRRGSPARRSALQGWC